MKKNIITCFLFILLIAIFISCSKDDEIENPPVTKPDDEKVEDPPVTNPDEEDNEGPRYEYYIGSLFGFDKSVRTGSLGNSENTTLYNLPLFSPPNTEEEWWDNLVEEFVYSGMDYAMANLRGILPDPKKYTDHGDPNRVKYLVDAIERLGVSDKLKIAIFDDCPASWAAARNLDLYGSYASNLTEHPYPVDQLDGDGGIYKYIWDYNLKIAFQNIPDKYLFKYKDRPVIFFWSVNNFLNSSGSNNYNGKLSKILKRIRADFQEDFGSDPFIIVDKSFYDRDNTVYYPVTDAINNWFTMNEPYTVRVHNGVRVGVAIPGFSINDKKGNKMFVDAKHGNTLDKALDDLVIAKSDIILIEGFTDVRENAALWRSTDNKYYDYPNQRINIVRRYSNDPYPNEFKVEAEGCDFYYDNTAGNNGGVFRKGDLDVKKCTDIYGGWCITNTDDGEWLQWKELPIREKTSTFKIRYASNQTAKICFNVDGVDGATIELPNSNKEWKTINAGTIDFEKKALHDVILKIVSGNIDINYFIIVAAE